MSWTQHDSAPTLGGRRHGLVCLTLASLATILFTQDGFAQYNRPNQPQGGFLPNRPQPNNLFQNFFPNNNPRPNNSFPNNSYPNNSFSNNSFPGNGGGSVSRRRVNGGWEITHTLPNGQQTKQIVPDSASAQNNLTQFNPLLQGGSFQGNGNGFANQGFQQFQNQPFQQFQNQGFQPQYPGGSVQQSAYVPNEQQQQYQQQYQQPAAPVNNAYWLKRFVVRNNTGEHLTVRLQYCTLSDQNEWVWMPGGDRNLVCRLSPGEESYIDYEGEHVAAGTMLLWAQSPTRRWDRYRENGLLLVEPNENGQRVYYATSMQDYVLPIR